MGFIRDTGKFLGSGAGFVIGKPIKAIGDVTNIEVVSKIGDGVYHASKFAGDTVGQVIDGAVDTTYGLVQNDQEKLDQGLNNMGNAVSRTGQGIYHTAKNTYCNGKEVYTGIKESDMQKVKRGAEGIAATVAVGALAIGVVDFVDGTDGSKEVSAETNNSHGEPGAHSVQPHYVEGYVKADGTVVDGYWRDGNGNPSVDRTAEEGGGYMRSNPDGDSTNNLRG